jgi:ribose/xylose/arabinose/galactoside ABC-type transport system permease subunit
VSAATVAEPAARRGPSPLRRWLLRPEAPAVLFLLAVVVLFGALTDNFLRLANLQQILIQVSTVAIIALAVNQLIIAGEIDISMGSSLGLCAVAVGTVAVATGGLILPLLTGVAVGALIGATNGLLVTVARVPAIIVTLGMLYALRGVIFFVTGGASVSGIPMDARLVGRERLFGVGYSVWLLLALLLATWFVSRHTTWGRDVYAVGGNQAAARLAGLPIARTRFLGFVGVGVFTGLAALVYVGRTGGVQTSAGTGLELEVIAAVVLGGTSIAGGRGSVLSPVVGAVLVSAISTGMVLLRVPATWQSAVLGALILLAISFDGIRRRQVRGAA